MRRRAAIPTRWGNGPSRAPRGLASVAALLVAGLSSIRCDSPYPVPPTACDDWCLATQRADCEEDYPEGCVSDCEDRARRRLPRCQPSWQALMACYFDASDSDFQCIDDESRPRPVCIDERVALSACTSPVRGLCLQVCFREAVGCGQPERLCEAQCRPGPSNCQQFERALYECQLREPVDCVDPPVETRDASDIPCLAEIGALLDCAGFVAPAVP